MKATTENDLLTVSATARILDLSPCRVRQLADTKQLPAFLTTTGQRLFRRADVEREAQQRRQQANASER